ncbi:MAG: slipin family protein [Candidatus Diapherotrites archaeon]|nr:slipin family protein [Candidatus Diapherotrites archaeon]MBT4596740.1 slipin family protein [Candidatus Diapherotrites archaeon]
MVLVFLSPIILIILLGILISSIKIINEYERGVKFTLGRYVGLMSPGIRLVLPIIQTWRRIDIRTKVVDVPKQDIMTKDNVSALVNAVVYYNVSHADKAVLQVIDYDFAIRQISQTTMREVIGEVDLDELLSKRDKTAKRMREILDEFTDPWGISVESVELKEIILPESLIRIISQEAEAEREKRAIILRAQGEMESAKNLRKAAEELTSVAGGIHLRTLQTIHTLSTEKSKTRLIAVPSELLSQANVKIMDLAKKLFK